MSPVHAMERSYGSIKHLLRSGQAPSGARLEANVLAQDLGVSMTPVRDALHRLAGERLVEATSGDGFRVPRYSEADLRDLYGWNATLMTLAARTVDISPALRVYYGHLPLADRFAALADGIAALDYNQEISAALLNASDRLQPFRISECRVFDDLATELAAIATSPASVITTIHRLHVRRIRAVAALLYRRDRL